MTKQAQSPISLNNELSSLEDTDIMWTNIEKEDCRIIPNTYTWQIWKEQMRRDFQKSINSTWINTTVNKARIHKVPSSNCNDWLVYVWVWHIQREIDVTNSLYLFLTISMQLWVFSVSNLWVEIIILFWDICDLLDRICRPHRWFVSDKPNLFRSTVAKKSLKCLVSLNRECFAHYRHISYFFIKSSSSLHVYTQGASSGFGLWAK